MSTIKYTKAQQSVIDSPDSNLQIIACAGSGKTQVMAARISELLDRPANVPSSIIAFTFTEKAATELKERVHKVVTERHGHVHGMAEMYVGTMHGFALNILQTHLYEFLKYSVLTDPQTKLFVNRNSKVSGLTTTKVTRGPSKGALLKRYTDTKTYLSMLNILREDSVNLELVPDEIKAALGQYQDLLAKHRYLDYAEILSAAVKALEGNDERSERLRHHIRETVRHVIVDEFQDVNPLQERLVRALHGLGAHVSVVGDDDQTIYQWRGSDISGIVTFADRFESVNTVTLDSNFRSSVGVVELAQKVAELNNPNRLDKKMVSEGHQQFERGDILALSFKDPEDEARWIADQIEALLGTPYIDQSGKAPRGLSWSDFAILLRSVKRSATPIVEEFRRRGIPFVVAGLNNLFDSPEIVASVAIFRHIVGEISESELRDAWFAADLGLTNDNLDNGIRELTKVHLVEAAPRRGMYSIQRNFQNFLEGLQLREETIPGRGRGEIVYFNLGKFSQAISDFEQIHFHSEPVDKYETFVKWLKFSAPSDYEEGGADSAYAVVDAVQISTIHSAKGLQWPAVFIPAMQHGRFPSGKSTGRSVWHVLPEEAVGNANRYKGGIEDERRLFYVAVTRSEKYLFMTHAPEIKKKPSEFFIFATSQPMVLTKQVERNSEKLDSRPRTFSAEVSLNFSELKYFFECPYQFKLRFLYGFNPPVDEALGFGKSLHDCMAEIHKSAMDGVLFDPDDAERLVRDHLHVPFAYPALRKDLEAAAVRAVRRYLENNAESIAATQFSEKGIEVKLADGVTVVGRIDLVRRTDTDEVSIVDFKSTERAQAEDVTFLQLQIYAIGYQELTGRSADVLEVKNLDERGVHVREVVNSSALQEVSRRVAEAGDAVRARELPRITDWCASCAKCDVRGLCRNAK
jgi:DNA helicase-2/ATP-dependent DNA helicase PcrA